MEGKKLNVAWTKDWGTNATLAELHIDGKHIASVDKTLTPSEEASSWQGDFFTIEDISVPAVNITNPQISVQVILKNDAGSTATFQIQNLV